MSSDQLSPVSTLCLAILHRGDATGYEIKKESVEGDYRYFIDASYGAIYPALARLAADKMVTQREETQPGRPARKIYSITTKGRSALLDALAEPPGPDVFRARFLLTAKFASELPADAIDTALAERRKHIEDDIAHLNSLLEEEKDSPAAQWIVSYGLACLTASLKYLDDHGEALTALGEKRLADAAE